MNPVIQIDQEKLDLIARNLSTTGYSAVADFFSHEITSELAKDFENLHSGGQFKRAQIGSKGIKKLADEVRQDEILWLDSGDLQPPRRELLSAFNDLRIGLNQRLYLGLWELEAHYAHYPAGGFYRRHLDRFTNDDTRMISLVTYFNSEWAPEHGGELMIYAKPDDSEPVQVVEPRAGTLVCFRSDLIEHEVRPAHLPRRSLAGWFRRRSI